VAVSAGAQTRWAGIFAGVWLAALVLVAGSLAELIPMPVIGGLMLVIGAELVIGRWADIKLVLRAAPWSAVAMIVTFLATTQLPLHTAILIGAITSLVLYCVKASGSAKLMGLKPVDGGWERADVPATCPSDEVTVLHYAGIGLFAAIPAVIFYNFFQTKISAYGTRSEGFKTIVFPVAMAYGKNQNGTIPGKLNGVMAATTPRGWRIIVSSMPRATSSRL